MQPARIPALRLIAAVLAVGASLVISAPLVSADNKKHDDRGGGAIVVIDGGVVTNDTSVNISADGGTAIGDASGGDGNVAIVSDRNGDDDFDIASAGNGGTATASANGGAVVVGDINSGGNLGNVITVGNTSGGGHHAAPPKAVPPKPAPPKPAPVVKKPVVVKVPVAKAPAPPARVRPVRLPAAGVGLVQGQSGGDILLLLAGSMTAAGAASVALRKRTLAGRTV